MTSTNMNMNMKIYMICLSILSVTSLLAVKVQALGLTDYITQRGSNDRLGYFPNANLDPAVVSSSSFGRQKLIQLPPVNGVAPGNSYATPLLYTPSGSTRQVAVITTMSNNVYTVDAITGAVLASRNLELAFNVTQ
ncbi:hypothetical protein HDU76_007206, partial [Blyttiomyces sp. JEL0837]